MDLRDRRRKMEGRSVFPSRVAAKRRRWLHDGDASKMPRLPVPTHAREPLSPSHAPFVLCSMRRIDCGWDGMQDRKWAKERNVR